MTTTPHGRLERELVSPAERRAVYDAIRLEMERQWHECVLFFGTALIKQMAADLDEQVLGEADPVGITDAKLER